MTYTCSYKYNKKNYYWQTLVICTGLANRDEKYKRTEEQKTHFNILTLINFKYFKQNKNALGHFSENLYLKQNANKIWNAKFSQILKATIVIENAR